MSDNLGTGVSYVDQVNGYNYDTVVFQKGKPPLDTELNAVQQIQNLLAQRGRSNFPSGWLTIKPYYLSSQLQNSFYTQDPSTATPEYALVNGDIIYVTNTATTTNNANLIDLGAPPDAGNVVNGVYLEVWRALLSPTSSTNRPAPETVVDALYDIAVMDKNTAWAVGENGLILATPDAGQTWSIQSSNTKNALNGVFFVTSAIGWAVGSNGCIIRTTSGGQRWNTLTTGFNQNLNSIYATSQLNAWAVGASGLILRTTNAVTWLPQISNIPTDLNGVYFSSLNNNVGWIVGKAGVILRTTDGGANWIKVTSNTTVDLNSVFFYNLSEGFVVGNSGVILKSTDGGNTWVAMPSGVSNDLTDVTMTPSLDQLVTDEEVSSQFTGSNKNFTVMNAPITVGDGTGTITNTPKYVIVTVNGSKVGVDVVIGATGQVVLTLPPRAGSTVKVTYNYKIANNVFRGNAYVTGQAIQNSAPGVILFSGDVGATWTAQNPGTAYDLNAVGFADLYEGWLVGADSIIRHTADSGITWTAQSSNIPYRQIQRSYLEGNILSDVLIPDDSIHPDTNIETTERVQLQYAIRVTSNVDPLNYPEAGLGSQVVKAIGPSTGTGVFPYQNMGTVTGDYGLWRAQCAGTVDGYCYAIPVAFVARRNSGDYDPSSNANGQTNYTTGKIRLDLLTANQVVDSDILDVRRQIQISSVNELYDTAFEQLMDGKLKTRMALDIAGGDKFGTEIFQLDRVGGGSGGTVIPNAKLLDAIEGNISSQASLVPVQYKVPVFATRADIVSKTFSPDTSGVFHPNSLYYSAIYSDTSLSIPGSFSGYGTNQLTFAFDSSANTLNEDSGLTNGYYINTTQINTSLLALTYVPSEPKLVKNIQGGSTPGPDIYYQGVFSDEVSGRIIESWPSDKAPTYNNYALVYPGSDTADSRTETMASTVEVHYYVTADSTNTSQTVSPYDTLTITRVPAPVDASSQYKILAVSKVNNITAGFNYKIKNLIVNSSTLKIQTVPGFPFVIGTVFEVIEQCLSTNVQNIRNGASVNFVPSEKKVESFCASNLALSISGFQVNPITVTLPNNDSIIGVCSTDTTGAINSILPFCWFGSSGLYGDIYPIQNINGFNTNSLTFDIIGVSSVSSTVTVQVLTKQKTLSYSNDGGTNPDGLMIGYDYIPYQSVSELPSTLSAKVALKPTVMNISSLGTGGSIFAREPYEQPLTNIPVNNPLLLTDDGFCNIEPLKFANFSVDGGFAQLPVYVPGNLGEILNLSNPVKDNLSRYFYSISSRGFNFRTEGLLTPISRKVFAGILGRVLSASDNRLLHGEYVLMLISQDVFLNMENSAGSNANNSVIAIYRLPNRPTVRI
jgi:Uncharacterized protein related to plant photosystem II stability/assembly factor